MSTSSRAFVVLALATTAAGPVVAQGFDITRALLNDSTVFEPFVVGETVLLREAVSRGTVDESTPVLVFETPTGPLALVTAQLAYHHWAQGEIAGEPWAVSF